MGTAAAIAAAAANSSVRASTAPDAVNTAAAVGTVPTKKAKSPSSARSVGSPRSAYHTKESGGHEGADKSGRMMGTTVGVGRGVAHTSCIAS